MEISKMLTLSTAYISQETAEWLNDQEEIVSYEKDCYGWFIYIPPKDSEILKEHLSNKYIPEDIKSLIKIAVEQDCVWICLDNSVQPILELPTYKW